MLKVKDGYAKVIGTTVNGSSDYLLLSNGGQKAVSDFAIKDHPHSYLPITGGTLTGPLTINPSSITSGSDSTEILKIYSSTGYKSGLSISSTDNLITINAKPFGTGTTTNALQINTYNGSSTVNAIRISAAGLVGIGTTAPEYKLQVNGDIYANGWLRTNDTYGWYSQTYGGGWYMNDSSWVKVWNDKGIYTDNEIKARMFRATTNDGAYLFGSSNAKISYVNNLLIFNTGDAIRLGRLAGTTTNVQV